MFYTLSDGRQVDLTKVKSVTKIRDTDRQKLGLAPSRIGFSIRMKGSNDIEVYEEYNFSDWGKAKKSIQQQRDALIVRIKELNPAFKD